MGKPQAARGGLAYGLAAYGFWGLMPIYFRAVGSMPGIEVLAHRIVWCALLLVGVLSVLGRWPQFRDCFRSRRLLLLLSLSSLLIAVNWFAYIHGAFTERIAHTSLGYFMTPLFSVVLGLLFFGERLRPAQWAAVALAACGLIYLIARLGELPWIALAVGSSFSLYGLVRKVAPVDSLTGLLVETLLLSPLALGLLIWWSFQGRGAFGSADLPLDGLLMLSGVVTAIPLLCFGQAARRLPLSVLGFLQYISPTLQFLLAVCLYREPFEPATRISFGLIWAALVLFSLDSLWARRPIPRQANGGGKPEVDPDTRPCLSSSES